MSSPESHTGDIPSGLLSDLINRGYCIVVGVFRAQGCLLVLTMLKADTRNRYFRRFITVANIQVSLPRQH